jgi:hypothetical protein
MFPERFKCTLVQVVEAEAKQTKKRNSKVLVIKAEGSPREAQVKGKAGTQSPNAGNTQAHTYPNWRKQRKDKGVQDHSEYQYARPRAKSGTGRIYQYTAEEELEKRAAEMTEPMGDLLPGEEVRVYSFNSPVITKKQAFE